MSEQTRAKRHTTDQTDEQWVLIELLAQRKPRAGRPTRVYLREVLNALL